MSKSKGLKKLQKLPCCARYTLPVHDQLLQEELRRIDRSSRVEARAAQHAILLKLATLAHARHVRDKKVDTLTRLMASESTKLKLQAIQTQRSTSVPRTVMKRNTEDYKRQLSKEARTEQGKDSLPQKSTSSGSSGHSGVSQVTRFAEEPEIFPQTLSKRKPVRARAYSVDLMAHPITSAKRRQSAPEVVVTPAATEKSTDLTESQEPKLHEGHLSPAYSAITEFFAPDLPLTQQDISETEEDPTTTKGSKTHTENFPKVPAQQNDSKSPSKILSSLTTSEVTPERRGGIGSAATSLSSALFLKKGSRKVSRSTSSTRRRSSHLSPKGQVKLHNEDFNPEKDPRFTDLMAALKSTPVIDATAGVRAIQGSRDHSSSDASTTTYRQSTSESRSPIGASRSSSKSTVPTSSVS